MLAFLPAIVVISGSRQSNRTYTQQNMKCNSTTLSSFRKITLDETIEFAPVQMQVGDCCIAHLLQPGVKPVFKKTSHKAEGGKL